MTASGASHDERGWMSEALDLAQEAMEHEEVPIGSVVVHLPSRRVIGRGFNRREMDFDPSGHAEIVAMRQAGNFLSSWRLDECAVVVTLEPCAMCAGAMVNARVARL